MLQIKYNTDFLTIAQDTETEIERHSTVFLTNELLLEYSIPITIPYTDLNSRLLGHRFFEITDKEKGRYDVEVYDNGTYRYNATLIIQSSNIKSTVPGKGNATGFLLIGVSKFFNAIKDTKLNTLDFGGPVSHNWTSWNPYDASSGYWQHFHDTWNYNENYVVAPIKMDTWTAYEEDNGWMNEMGASNQLLNTTIIGLQIKLSYLLQKIFTEHGWTLDDSQLDSNYEKIVVFSARPIKINNQGTAINPISIDLADHISPEVTCASFLLSRCKRYGWAPIFDAHRNSCTLVPVNDIANGTIKDFTPYAGDDIEDDYSGDAKVFAFSNNLPEDDGYPVEPNTTSFTVGTPVLTEGQLPDPSTGIYDEQIKYVFATNRYYKVEFDSTTSTREWVYYGDNIFNQEPDDSNETIETDCSTLPMVWSEGTHGALVPIAKQPMDKNWGMRDLLWHGVVNVMDDPTTVGTDTYPMVSSLANRPDGNIMLPWSNVYSHEWDGDDYGIVNKLWSNFTEAIASPRDIQRDLFLPLHVLVNLRWNDVINIRNIPYLIKSYLEPLPYKGFIRATLQKCEIHGVEEVANGSTGQTVYLLIEWYSQSGFATFGDYENGIKGSVRVKAFSDAAGTIPITPTGLTVKYYVQRFDDSVGQVPSYQQFTMNTQTHNLFTDVVREGEFTPNGEFHEYFYELVAYTGYVII